MSDPLQTHFRDLPTPLQRALEQFAGLPGPQRTAARLTSLVDGHLEAYGLADDARRSHYLSCAIAVAQLRFNIRADRRAAAREPGRAAAA